MTGIPAPTWSSVLTSWTATPIPWVLMALATIGYAVLVVRLRRAGGHWSIWRTLCWVAAMVVLVLALNSALARYSMVLFWVHMIVHLLMIMVAPAFLVAAQPIRLLHDGSGPRVRTAVGRVVGSKVWRYLTSPALTVPLYTAVIVGTHLTGFQQAMLQNMWLHHLELVLYLVSGYLLFLPLIGDELIGRTLAHPLRLAVMGLTMGPDTLVGVTLMMTGKVLAPAFAEGRMMGWGPSALSDQSAAGAIMWFAGDGLMMVLMVIAGFQMIRSGNGMHSLGPWLDGIRRQATLGDTLAAGDAAGGGPDIDIDDEQAALDAYNARLAAMHGLPPKPKGPDRD